MFDGNDTVLLKWGKSITTFVRDAFFLIEYEKAKVVYMPVDDKFLFIEQKMSRDRAEISIRRLVHDPTVQDE